MQRSQIPFNVSLLELTPKNLSTLRPVTVLDTFDGGSGNFHENGLFSVSIFGKVGDDRRSARFSYIDIKVHVFHPIVYRALVSLKRLYAGILSGKEYARWNEEVKDFERSDALQGQTGYHFFMSKWESIEFEETRSASREQNILLIKKYKTICTTNKIIVMPAGLRDVEIGADGRVREDEINTFYKKLLSLSNTISDASAKNSQDILNTVRYSIQATFNELYDILESMIEGKKKLLMDKWASRRLMNGTRNVITAMDTSTVYLGSPGSVKFNNTVIGLYQAMKAIMPVARYFVRNGFLSKVFISVDQPARLVNKKTMKMEEVTLKSVYFDRWMTDEGLEKVITSFGEEALRNKVLEIEDHYIGLIYKGPDSTFKMIQDIDEVPPTRDKKHVYPLRFCELMYLSGYKDWNRYPLFFTRYPVTGVGSIYPSKMFVKTTIKSEERRELNDAWEPMAEEYTAFSFPTSGPYVNSLVPHSAKIERAGADFDGDTASGNGTYSDESIQEVNEYFTKKKAYVGTDGRFTSSAHVSTVALVLHNLTGN